MLAWRKICASKKVGGLGCKDQSIVNNISMAKLYWKLHSSKNLASEIKYCEGREHPTLFKYGSHIWQDMRKGWDIFERNSGWSIGTGNLVSFWFDHWTPFGRLRELVSGPISPEEYNRKVSSVIEANGWNLSTLSLALPPHIIHWIERKPLTLREEDELVCWKSRGTYFDSRSTYEEEWTRNPGNRGNSFDWDIIWHSPCLPKIQNFLWAAIWDCLPTKQNLMKRCITTSDNCPFCQTISENREHVLRDCIRAREVWDNYALSNNFYDHDLDT